SQEAAGQRLDIALAAHSGLSRTVVQRLIRDDAVALGGNPVTAKQIVNEGEEISYSLPLVEEVDGDRPAPVLEILYEDTDILAVNKPAGLLVHPGNGRANESTVADFAKAHGVEDSDIIRPGIVHRLDRDTSGILVLSKTEAAKAFMQKQFADREVKKTYILLVIGRVTPDSARIDLPIGRDPRDGSRRTVASDGRPAQTTYRTLAYYPGFTLLEAHPETGRTHQLRVHFAATGNPIVGDGVYGPKRETLGLKRHFLHAAQLSFTAPSGKQVDIESPLPDELQTVLNRLGEDV
ncbi:MAG: RluA family pseudouridine synthase, partial [Candidatus Saccharibacteria bacterium]